jgi:hypothetical protein
MMTSFDVGFTATQAGLTDAQLSILEEQLRAIFARFQPIFRGENSPVKFHHGDCVGGDEQAHAIAMAIGYRVVIHPPFDPKKRAWCDGHLTEIEKSYLERNRDIVDISNILLAGPQGNEILRSGTWSTIRYAQRLSHHVRIIFPKGNVTDIGADLFSE